MIPSKCLWLCTGVASLALFSVVVVFAASPPVGILTLANHAHLGNADAYPGLSVFEGEPLSTDVEGRLSLRVGRSVLTLAGKTDAILIPIEKGVHVDMSAGSVHFSAAENETVEMHADDAIIRPGAPQATQAAVTILGTNLLQIAAERGTLSFSYREESRNLPAGYVYRIYLDDRDGVPDVQGGAARKTGGKVGYFIVGAVASAGAWAIEDLIKNRNADISPANP
jgi:hypothetical protein